ncbi:hypothetical protein ROU88_11865, partial [Macrococcus capreoli]
MLLLLLLISNLSPTIEAAAAEQNSISNHNLNVQFKSQINNNIYWEINFNRNDLLLQDNRIKMNLSGSHALNIPLLEAELKQYNIKVTKSDIANEYILEVPENLKQATFNVVTNDQTNTQNNKLKISGVMN